MTMVLRHSHFPADPWGDGGSKRTAQISEILSDFQIETVFYDPDITQIFKKQFAALEGIKLLNQHKIKSSLSKTALTQLGFNYYKRAQTMAHYKKLGHQLLLWESTRDQNYLMGYAAKDNDLNVIGLPHNLESLVAGQKSDFTAKTAPYWFGEELDSLRKCDAIFTISREEQYLLKLFGLQAEFLPYYPTRDVVAFLQNIRQKRLEESTPHMILLLGTAGNKPTFDGMLNRIRFFAENVHHSGLTLHVAGFLTELLAGHFPAHDRIVLHGSVSNEKLASLMTQCGFCWIHQNISTGSLTKIPELMIAGVPVLLNSDAARNFHNVPGIQVYEHDTDCLEALQKPIPTPMAPARPLVHEQILLSTMQRLGTTFKPR